MRILATERPLAVEEMLKETYERTGPGNRVKANTWIGGPCKKGSVQHAQGDSAPPGHVLYTIGGGKHK